MYSVLEPELCFSVLEPVSRPMQPSSVFQPRFRLPAHATTGGRWRRASSGFPPCCCLPADVTRCGAPQENVFCRSPGPGSGVGLLRVPHGAPVGGLWSCFDLHDCTRRHRSASSQTRLYSTRVHPRRSGRSCGLFWRPRERGSAPEAGWKRPPGGSPIVPFYEVLSLRRFRSQIRTISGHTPPVCEAGISKPPPTTMAHLRRRAIVILMNEVLFKPLRTSPRATRKSGSCPAPPRTR